MVKFKQPDNGNIRTSPGFGRGEKMKLFLMCAGVILIGGAFLYSLQSGARYRRADSENLPRAQESPTPEETVYLPDVDRDALEGLVRDSEGADRVMLEPAGVEAIIPAARQMTAHSYRIAEQRGTIQALDSERCAEIATNPSQFRGDPTFARGWIDAIEERRAGPTSQTRYLGRLILEDEGCAFFLCLRKPDNVILGDFVRMDGLFLKVYSDEQESGDWIEGPLIVGQELQRSYPSFGPVTTLDERVLGGVTDDTATGITGLPFKPLWHLMAYTRDHDGASVEWDSAPVLDKLALEEVLRNGHEARYGFYRIPVSRLQSITIKRAGENPARINRYTEGWIGNTAWKNVIHYVAPFEFDGAQLSDLVSARGIFFKNYAYEPLAGGVHVAPVFVLTDIESFERPSSAVLTYMGYAIAASGLGLVILLSILLTRDKRSSQTLQNRLIQRRRARREATA